MSNRTNHDAAFKARVLLEALKGARSVLALAALGEVHPPMMNQWKKALLLGAIRLFRRGSKRGSGFVLGS
jgi:transposase